MKRVLYLITFFFIALLYNCSKDEDKPSERFILLTTPIWESYELLVDGEDASGEGELLENFKGDAKFNIDGTGYFGQYTGSWNFVQEETELQIVADELDFTITTKIVELNASVLKVTTYFFNFQNPEEPLFIELSFNAK